MDRIYSVNPSNFSEIEPYVLTEEGVISEEIIRAAKCYFYDACSFRNHMVIQKPELLFEYIKQTGGIVILTRTVLMELCSGDGKLWIEHIEYIKKLYFYDIKVLILYEEDLFHTLHLFCSEVATINKWLSLAVKCAKSKVGKTDETIMADAKLKDAMFKDIKCADSKLAQKMFQAIRRKKSSQDNMGEELLAICLHWLSRIREKDSYKYVVLTDDKKSIAVMGKVIKNVYEYSGCRSIAVCTTTKLCFLMKKAGIVEQKEQIMAIFENSNLGKNLKVYCSGEYELEPSEKNMSLETFAENLITEKMKVYY